MIAARPSGSAMQDAASTWEQHLVAPAPAQPSALSPAEAVVADRPGVGENLQDRYEVGVVYQLKKDFALLAGGALCAARPCLAHGGFAAGSHSQRSDLMAGLDQPQGDGERNAGIAGISGAALARVSAPQAFAEKSGLNRPLALTA